MKLGEYLQKNGISQRAFGAKVGASQGMVSHVITGRARLTGAKTLMWSEATKWRVTPHEIDASTYPNPTDGIPPEHQTTAFSEGKLNHENQTRAHP